MPGQPISSLSVNNSGALYTSIPAVTISLPQADSQAAEGSLTLDQNGIITSVSLIDSGGTYYTSPPTTTISDISYIPNRAPEVLAVFNTGSNKISEMQVFFAGTYYTGAPSVVIDPPHGPALSNRANGTAVASADLDGKVNVISNENITLVDSGHYYTSQPSVVVDPPVSGPYKFGNGSLENLDSNWYQEMLTNAALVTTNDSTNSGYEINFWLYPTVDSVNRSIFYSVDSTGAAGTIKMGISDSNRITWATNGSSLTSTGTINNNDWNWIQMAHNGSTVRLTVNSDSNSAVLSEATPASPVANVGDKIFFGRDSNSALLPSFNKAFIGYIDNYRININDSNVGVPSNILPDSEYAGWDDDRHIIDYKFAKVAAQIDAIYDSINNSISGFNVTDGGSGYKINEAISFTAHGGQDEAAFTATAIATVLNGQISSIDLTDSGEGYTDYPAVTISSNTGTDSDFTLTDSDFNITTNLVNNRVASFNIISGGLFIDSANISIAPPTGSKETFRATAVATLDSSSGTITALTLTDSGDFYTSPATLTIEPPLNDAAFQYGEQVSQTLSNGVVITGEVVAWSDSDNKLQLVHVGADDGQFHVFTASASRPITGSLSGGEGIISNITEDNQISENEQNDDFSTIAADFLDFSEANPFGDPENN